MLSGAVELNQLSQAATQSLHQAYRPKTQRCYYILFRTFVAFCLFMHIKLVQIDINNILCFLELLCKNSVSAYMISNYLAAIRASFILYGLNDAALYHQRINLFIRAIKINRPLRPVKRNIMDVPTLKQLSSQCSFIYMSSVYTAGFLVAFFKYLTLPLIL